MSSASDLIRPDGLKILLCATFLVPVFFGIILATGFPYDRMLPAAVITLVLSYAAACIIDTAIQSRTAKIAIASVAALLSLILGSLIIRGMSMVCDPVHEPGGVVCDPVHIPQTTPPVAPTVISTVPPHPTTPMIFDPVHEPGSCGPDACTMAPGIVPGIVAQKLDECLKECGR